MKQTRRSGYDVAVIGAGFAGTLTAVQVARQARAPVRILLVDKSGTFGRGLAYRATSEGHLLNVPVGKMGAFPENIAHFAEEFDLPDPDSFENRTLYGDYVSDLLDTIAKRTARIDRVDAEIVDIRQTDGRFVMTSSADDAVEVTIVVLALGNFQASHFVLDALGVGTGPFYIDDPLDGAALDAVAQGEDVLVVGTGLTALDCMTSLHRRSVGLIHLTSRRGLLAQMHKPYPAIVPPPQELQSLHRAIDMLRCIRRMTRECAECGIDWRPVIDGLRPITQSLWLQLDLRERNRFLRHLRPFWETHRHRCAPELLEGIQNLIRTGRVVRHAGRIISAEKRGQGLRVTIFDRRRQATVNLDVKHVLNCTGPESDYRRVESRLVQSLLTRGLIAADPTRLGLNATVDGRVLSRDGTLVSNMFAIGSPLKGILYETTAVPEIRVQARDLGRRLSETLERTKPVHRAGG